MNLTEKIKEYQNGNTEIMLGIVKSFDGFINSSIERYNLKKDYDEEDIIQESYCRIIQYCNEKHIKAYPQGIRNMLTSYYKKLSSYENTEISFDVLSENICSNMVDIFLDKLTIIDIIKQYKEKYQCDSERYIINKYFDIHIDTHDVISESTDGCNITPYRKLMTFNKVIRKFIILCIDYGYDLETFSTLLYRDLEVDLNGL